MAKKYYLIFFLAFIASTLIAIRVFYPRIYSEQYEIIPAEIILTPTLTPIPTPKIIGEEAIVESIVDGETIILEDGRKVRYIGVNAPKMYDSSSYGRYALDSANKNIELVEGKKVLLIKDIKEIDDSDNLLRYVYLDNLFIRKFSCRNCLHPFQQALRGRIRLVRFLNSLLYRGFQNGVY